MCFGRDRESGQPLPSGINRIFAMYFTLLCTLGTSWAFISQIISSDLNEPIKHQDPFQLLLFAAVTGFTKPFQIIDVSHTFIR